MAKKPVNPLDDPPTSSSSSDDDVVETSSGEEPKIPNSSSEPKIPTTKTLKSPPTSAPSSDSVSGTAEKTTTAKPKKKKKEVHDSGKKRASEVTPAKDMHVKRARNVSRDYDKKSGEDNKKVISPRLWSEEDEISVLQGIIVFEDETGTNPYDDMNRFYDFAKKFGSFDVSKMQLTDKIRSLKRKYIGKDKKGKESSFSKPHDQKCLGLARYIWRSDGMSLESAVKAPGSAVESPVKSNKVEKKKLDLEEVENEDKEVVESDVGKAKSLKLMGDKVNEVVNFGGDTESSNWFDKSFLLQSCASLGANASSVKQKWSKVPIETKNRMKEKLKLVEVKEFELLSQKTEILKEVIFVMSKAI